ncbi:MAG: hypothetical protein RLZZ224_1970 [Verrucomicrobiota bacterium]
MLDNPDAIITLQLEHESPAIELEAKLVTKPEYKLLISALHFLALQTRDMFRSESAVKNLLPRDCRWKREL